MHKVEDSAAAFRAGRAAFVIGQPVTAVPSENIWTAGDWLDGWESAKRENQVDEHVEQEIKDGNAGEAAGSKDAAGHRKAPRKTVATRDGEGTAA